MLANDKYSNFRVCLEPMEDASMRSYCDANGMTYAMFMRLAIKHMFETTTKKDKAKIESRRDIYGRLGHASFSVRLTNAERRDVVRFARSLNIPEQRSFSRLLRYAVKLYLCACDDAKRQAQSPEPASEDSPPRPAS